MSGTFNKLNSSLKMQQRKQLKLSSGSQSSLQVPPTPDMKPKAIPPPPQAKPLGAKFPPPPPLVALGSHKPQQTAASSSDSEEEEEDDEEDEEVDDPSETDLERS